MTRSFGQDNKTATEADAFHDTAIKQEPYINAFFEKHRNHNIREFEVQDSTVIMCDDCQDWIQVN